MCHNGTINNKTICLHDICLNLIYNDKKSYLEDLLEKDEYVTTHDRTIRTLALEFLKDFKNLSSVIFAEAFPVRQQSQYSKRNDSYFAMHPNKTVNSE